MSSFFDHAIPLLARTGQSQADAISRAATAISNSLLAGGVWHLFGTGHSHLAAEEMYYRAGGLAPVNAILFPALMQHEGPATSTRLERLPGLAAVLYEKSDIRPGEVLTIISNSGKNAVPVEMALLAKEKGATSVALTSLAQSQAAQHGFGMSQKLFEVCDIVIDNGGNLGDACLPIPGHALVVGATSTLVNVAILQQMAYEVCLKIAEAGVEPPVFKSANLPGGDAWNAALIARYGGRVNLA